MGVCVGKNLSIFTSGQVSVRKEQYKMESLTYLNEGGLFFLFILSLFLVAFFFFFGDMRYGTKRASSEEIGTELVVRMIRGSGITPPTRSQLVVVRRSHPGRLGSALVNPGSPPVHPGPPWSTPWSAP